MNSRSASVHHKRGIMGSFSAPSALLLLGLALLAAPTLPVQAFPPAPHHLIFGSVRDEYGTPLDRADAVIIFQTSTGIKVRGSILPGVGPGINYQIQIPMDAGTSPDLYQATALRANVTFKIYVVTDQDVYIPIQMTGDFSKLGQPGKQTRIDLTLGEDLNHDGLPDAWELVYLASLGLDLSLDELTAGMSLGNGARTLQEEFLLGYFPFDPVDSLAVRIVNSGGGSPVLEFTSMMGRSYVVLGSSDLQNWSPVTFRLPAEGAAGGAHSYYYSPAINTVQLQVIQPESVPAATFFRIQLQ
jgi:hypothetical protein